MSRYRSNSSPSSACSQARTVDETLNNYPEISHVLILHDVDDKETRRGYQEDFKKGKIDLLVVFNMLLTGFDAPRLKKQYLGRLIKEHNLLQPHHGESVHG